jgi:uncharacterized membrane protein
MNEMEYELEGDEPIERVLNPDLMAERIQRRIRQTVDGGSSRLRSTAEFLQGKQFGYPLHPSLVTVAGGFWMSSVTMDILGMTRIKGFSRAADSLLFLGVLSAVPAAAAGLLEFSKLPEKSRVHGMRHGLLGLATALLWTASLLLRMSGRRKTAVMVSLVADGTGLMTMRFGRQLVFRYGAGRREGEAEDSSEQQSGGEHVFVPDDLGSHSPIVDRSA